MSRIETIIVEKIPDEFWNQKSKIGPKVLDIKCDLARKRKVYPTVWTKSRKLILL